MFSRFGLRFGMAMSYVLVSAVAVLLVEAVLLTAAVPRIRAADQGAADAEVEASQRRVEAAALQTATWVGKAASRVPGRPDDTLLAAAPNRRPAGHGRRRTRPSATRRR